MAGLWVNECGNALDVELSAGVVGVEGRGRWCNDGLRLKGGFCPIAAGDGCKRAALATIHSAH